MPGARLNAGQGISDPQTWFESKQQESPHGTSQHGVRTSGDRNPRRRLRDAHHQRFCARHSQRRSRNCRRLSESPLSGCGRAVQASHRGRRRPMWAVRPSRQRSPSAAGALKAYGRPPHTEIPHAFREGRSLILHRFSRLERPWHTPGNEGPHRHPTPVPVLRSDCALNDTVAEGGTLGQKIRTHLTDVFPGTRRLFRLFKHLGRLGYRLAWSRLTVASNGAVGCDGGNPAGGGY
jgi:hypothetical protein